MIRRMLPALLCAAILCAAPAAMAAEGLPSEVRFERAKVMVLKGDAAGAERELDALLAADPAFAPAKYLMGQVLFMKKEYARAAAMFDGYLKAEPSSEPAVRDLGVSLALAGKCTEALVFLGEALKGKPAGGAENYYAGLCLLREGRNDEAAARLAAAEAAGAGGFSLAARYNLALAYARMGKRDEAVRLADSLSSQKLPADVEGPVQRLRTALTKGGEREVSPWWISAAIGGQFDSNVVMLTEGTPQAVKDKVDTAAFRAFVLVSGGWAPLQDERRTLSLSLDAYRSFHSNADAAQFNLTSLQPALTYTARLGDAKGAGGARHTLSAGYEYGLNLFDGGDLNDVKSFGVFSQSHGLRLGWRGALWEQVALRGRYLFKFAEFANHDRSNFGHQAGFGPAIRFLHGRAGLLVEGTLRYEDAQSAFFDLLSPGAALTADARPLSWLGVQASLAVEREDHFRVDRTDWVKTASISLALHPWEHHAFVLMYEWTDDASTDQTYTYTRSIGSVIYAVSF